MHGQKDILYSAKSFVIRKFQIKKETTDRYILCLRNILGK